MKNKKPSKSPAMMTQEMLDSLRFQIIITEKNGGKGKTGNTVWKQTGVAASLFHSIFMIYPRLLMAPKGTKRLDMMRKLYEDCGKTLKTAKDFISVYGKQNSSIYDSSVFHDRRRPTWKSVNGVIENAGITDQNKCLEIQHAFGLHPIEEEPENMRKRSEEIGRKIRETIPEQKLSMMKENEYWSWYLGLSERRMNKLNAGERKTRPANAFHYIVALAQPMEEGRASDSQYTEAYQSALETLYHFFGYHPLKDGEADCLIQVCIAHYRKLIDCMQIKEEDRFTTFWGIVYCAADFYDEYFLNIATGKAMLPGMSKAMNLHSTECILLLPQMFYKVDEETVDKYFILLDDLLDANILPESIPVKQNGKGEKR